MKDINNKVIEFIKVITQSWPKKIQFGIELNLPIALDINKTDWEALSCLQYGIKGTGKNSGDNDHDNGDETKGANKIRAKSCKCGKTSHWFSKVCVCGLEEFDYTDDNLKTDVRWGIDTSAHFKYNVPKYHLWILEAANYDPSNRMFYLKSYTISNENRVFNDILKVQNESGTKTKNFIPYSKDFYASNPKCDACYKIELDDSTGTVTVTSEKVDDIILSKQIIIKKLKKYLPKSFNPNKDTYHYDEIEKFLNVYLYETTHGKPRGKTTRRSKQNL
jgi:hypothetical protein